MSTQHAIESIRAHVRDVPDFPKPGIVFKDITPLLAHPEWFGKTVSLL
ncbi:MAG: adenine phosphoribosyltransferase, partial [Pseudomonadota bacterium]